MALSITLLGVLVRRRLQDTVKQRQGRRTKTYEKARFTGGEDVGDMLPFICLPILLRTVSVSLHRCIGLIKLDPIRWGRVDDTVGKTEGVVIKV